MEGTVLESSPRRGTSNLRWNVVLPLGPINLYKKHPPEITFFQKPLGRNCVMPNVYFPKHTLQKLSFT